MKVKVVVLNYKNKEMVDRVKKQYEKEEKKSQSKSDEVKKDNEQKDDRNIYKEGNKKRKKRVMV